MVSARSLALATPAAAGSNFGIYISPYGAGVHVDRRHGVHMRRSAAFIIAFIALTLLVGSDADARLASP